MKALNTTYLLIIHRSSGPFILIVNIFTSIKNQVLHTCTPFPPPKKSVWTNILGVPHMGPIQQNICAVTQEMKRFPKNMFNWDISFFFSLFKKNYISGKIIDAIWFFLVGKFFLLWVWPGSSPHLDLNTGHQHESQMTNELSYPLSI